MSKIMKTLAKALNTLLKTVIARKMFLASFLYRLKGFSNILAFCGKGLLPQF